MRCSRAQKTSSFYFQKITYFVSLEKVSMAPEPRLTARGSRPDSAPIRPDAAGIPADLSDLLAPIQKKPGEAPTEARRSSERHRRDSVKRPALLRTTTGPAPEGVRASSALLLLSSRTPPVRLRDYSERLPQELRRNSGRFFRNQTTAQSRANASSAGTPAADIVNGPETRKNDFIGHKPGRSKT